MAASEIAEVINTYNPHFKFVVCINRTPYPNFYRLSREGLAA